MPDRNHLAVVPGDPSPGRHRRGGEPGQIPPPEPGGTGPLTLGQWRAAVTRHLARLSPLLATPAGRPEPQAPGPPGDHPAWRQAVSSALVSLSELAAEITTEISPDPEFTAMVRQVLRDHCWALGYQFAGEQAPGDWEPPWLTADPDMEA